VKKFIHVSSRPTSFLSALREMRRIYGGNVQGVTVVASTNAMGTTVIIGDGNVCRRSRLASKKEASAPSLLSVPGGMLMMMFHRESEVNIDSDEEVPTTASSSFLPLIAYRDDATNVCPRDDTPTGLSPPSGDRPRRRRRSQKGGRSSSSQTVADAARRRLTVFSMCLALLLFVLRANNNKDGGDDSADGVSPSSSNLPTFNGSAWVESLTESLETAKKELATTLRDDYGRDVADRLFMLDDDTTTNNNNNNKSPSNGSARGQTVFEPANLDDPKTAWDGFGRKIAMKLVQSAMLRSHHNPSTPSSPSVPPTLVWATAGHSAAAGHGNLYNQSYTAVMEQRLQSFFHLLGVQFVGRNYAVGGASSGPEIALCLGPLLGHNDVDVVSWDYGMTDGSFLERLELFMVRAAHLPSRPVAVAFPREQQMDGEDDAHHRQRRRHVLANLAQYGLPAFVQDEAEFQNLLKTQVPDTFGKTQAEIDRMTRFTRSFVCQGQVEEGDPYCDDEKFDMTVCPDRRFRTSWHPGWKWHAYQGNLMAMFVVEAVERSIAMLRQRVGRQEDVDVDLTLLLEELMNSESNDYQSVLGNVSARLPPHAHRYHRPQQRDGDDDHEGDDDSTPNEVHGDADDDGNQWLRQLYYTSPNYCHIALLPSEIRYRGILKEHPAPPMLASGLVVTNPVDFEPALVRNPWEAIRDDEDNNWNASSSDEMLLLGDPDTRQVDCPIPLNVDHQDFFFVSQRDGWRHVYVPNSREVEAYGSIIALHGVVALCYVGCPWGQCLATDMRWKSGSPNVVDLRVNGVDVTNLKEMDAHSNCFVLEHQGGFVWEPRHGGGVDVDDPSNLMPAVGQFRISARVSGGPTNYVRFSSFLLW
jgi:hypothetical protein